MTKIRVRKCLFLVGGAACVLAVAAPVHAAVVEGPKNFALQKADVSLSFQKMIPSKLTNATTAKLNGITVDQFLQQEPGRITGYEVVFQNADDLKASNGYYAVVNDVASFDTTAHARQAMVFIQSKRPTATTITPTIGKQSFATTETTKHNGTTAGETDIAFVRGHYIERVSVYYVSTQITSATAVTFASSMARTLDARIKAHHGK